MLLMVVDPPHHRPDERMEQGIPRLTPLERYQETRKQRVRQGRVSHY